MTWREAERLVASLVNGTVVTDKAKQLLDIDVEYQDHVGLHTVSVKYQPGVSKWRNVAFELELLDGQGGSQPGNWPTCRAEFYAVVSPEEPLKVGGDWETRPAVFMWNTATLAAVVNERRPGWKVKPLKGVTLAANERMGRTFTGSKCLIVPLEDIRSLCRWVRFMERPEEKAA